MGSGGFRMLHKDVQGLGRIVDELTEEHAMTRGALNQLASATFVNPRTRAKRGILERFKWLILGR